MSEKACQFEDLFMPARLLVAGRPESKRHLETGKFCACINPGPCRYIFQEGIVSRPNNMPLHSPGTSLIYIRGT
jgi:hypothetical protein